MAKSKDGRGFSKKSDFVKVVSEYYYVDKSLLIKDLIDNDAGDDVFLFTRPRRFGKSLMLSMLRTFFEKSDRDNSVYFKDLEIWKCGEKYTSEQGKYPVIHLKLKDSDVSTYDITVNKIKDRISDEFARHDELSVSKLVRPRDKMIYDRIVMSEATDSNYQDSLLILSRMLYAHHGVKPIILIDEYDASVQGAYEKGFYDDIVDFIRPLLSAALKDNENMTFAVVTGAMQIAKAGIYSGLNNLGVYSVLTDEYSQYFGFTKEEVKKILDDFGHPEKEKKILDWYDGYKFGSTEIFNPWSVARCIMKNFATETYWSHSTTESVVKDMLKVTNEAVSEDILKLSLGKKISVSVEESVSYADLKAKPVNVFSLLLATGYLKAVSKRKDGKYTLVLVNKEIKKIFREEIMDNVWPESSSDADRIREALIESDAEELEKALSDSMCREASFLDTVYENSYQCLMVGVLFHMSNLYIFRSNGRAGYGLYDIELTPKNVSRGLPGIIIETEWRKKVSELGSAADHALKQIEEKRYDVNIKEHGVEKIDKYGMAFCGQHVIVRKA